MLRLRSISLTQFKNYSRRLFTFDARVVAVCGNNGVGKTNLLDAIHYLSFTKSYFSRSDAGVLQAGTDGFRIEGELELGGKPEKAVCVFRLPGKKEFSIDGNNYERLSRHIGRYPSVVIAPDDALLITGGSEERRKFMDALLAQLDSEYLAQLIQYTRLIQQRNSLLKAFAERTSQDFTLLDVIDQQLEKPGNFIFQRRSAFLQGFLSAVQKSYEQIAMQQEDIALVYDSQLQNASLTELLRAGRQKDLASQRSHFGVHRDELQLQMAGQPFRQVASQGQRKSLLFALKLAELDVLRAEKGFSPLLMLDDVFEKLDEQRIGNLLRRVCVENDGQVLITDTNGERVRQHLEGFSAGYQLLEL